MAPALVAGGLAAGTKTTTIPLVAVLVGVAAVRHRHDSRLRRLPVGASAVVALFLGVVWLIQTTIHYGAPLYPWSRFPDGSPLPPILRYSGARFIDGPVAAIREGTPKVYVEALGGGVLLLVALPLVAAATVLIKNRNARIITGTASLAAVVALLLWSASPETGSPGQPQLDYLIVGTGVRFMLPALAAATVALGTLARTPGWPRRLASAVALLAIAVDLLAWSRPLYESFLPPHVLILAAFLGGLLLGSVSDRQGAIRTPFPRTAVRAATAVALVMLSVAVLATPVAGLVDRQVPIGLRLGDPAETALAYLTTQRGWLRTRTKVIVGPFFNAFFAGSTFNHPVGYVAVSTSCSTLQRDHRTAWIVLQDSGRAPAWMVPAFHKSRCLAGIKPAYRAGLVSVYAPATS